MYPIYKCYMYVWISVCVKYKKNAALLLLLVKQTKEKVK